MAFKFTEEQLNTLDKSFIVELFLQLQEQNDKLSVEIQDLNRKMELLIEQISLANKSRFGRSSEKLEDANQICFKEVDGNIVFFNENIGLYEDKLWLIELMPKIDSILFIPDVLYQYNYNSESLSNGANEENAYLAYIDFILPLIAREKGLDSIEFQGAAAFIYRKCWYETSRWKRADEIMKKTHLDWLQILYNIIDNNKSKNTPKDIFWLNLVNPFLHLYLNIKRK